MGFVAVTAHALYLGPAPQSIRAGHHRLIMHVRDRFAVAMGACNALEYVVDRKRLVVKIQVADNAQPIIGRHIDWFRQGARRRPDRFNSGPNRAFLLRWLA